MAVAYISDIDHASDTASSVLFTSYAVSGTNPVIVFACALNSATATVSSVACSAGLTGTATEVKTVRNSTTYLSIWAIPAPSGTGTVTVTFSTSVNFQADIALFQGADQTTPCPVGNAESTTGASPLTLTMSGTGSNDASYGICANSGGGDAPVFGPTEIFNNNSGNINAGAGYRIGAGSVTGTWGADSNNAIAAVRIVAVGGAAAAAGSGALLGGYRNRRVIS